MKKATSFLLALVMLVSLLPGTAVTVSAEEEVTQITTPTQNNYYSQVIAEDKIKGNNPALTRGKLGTSADEQYTTVGTDSVTFKTGTMSAEGVQKEVGILDFTSTGFDFNRGFELQFKVTFNDLVVPIANATASQIVSAGFSVDVRAASRCRYVFFADDAGNVWVSQYDTGTAVRFDTGINLGDKFQEVRIVVDDQMNSAVIVDGRFVAWFDAPAVSRPAGDYLVVYTGTKYRANDNHVNNVSLYDIKLSQTPEITNEMQAYYTFTEPYLDGEFKELNWAFDNGSKLALLSDENYLYAALKDVGDTVNFTANGVALTANLAAGTVTDANGKWVGTAAKNGSNAEVRIPLRSALGVEYAPGQKIDFAGPGFAGAAVLASRALVAYEGFDGTGSGLGNNANEVFSEQGNSALHMQTGTYVKGGTQTPYRWDIDAAQMVMKGAAELEFTADFTDLVVPAEGQEAYWFFAGFSVELRNDPCHRFSFHADAEGNIYITQRTDSSTKTYVDTGINAGDAAVNVRLAMDAVGETTIYVNGVACEQTLPSATFACPLTGGRGYYQIHNDTRYRDTSSSRVNDVTLYDLRLSQAVPMPDAMEQHPIADSNSADITAYLNPNGIQLDGVPNEAAWYIPYGVNGESTAPGGLGGISWGDGNLYIAGETAADTAAFAIGSQQVVASLRNRTAPSGQLAVGNDSFEWVIPLSRFGLPEGVLGGSVDYELFYANDYQEGYASVKGTLTFSGEQMLLGETGRNYTEKDGLLNSNTGHIHWTRTDEGFAVTAEGLNELKKGEKPGDDPIIQATGTFSKKFHIPVDYTSGAFDLTLDMTVNDLPHVVDYLGMRGLLFEVCGEQMRAVFALRKDADGNIWMDVRDTLDEQHYNTGVKVGGDESISFRISMDDKQSIRLYINDAFTYAFYPIDRRDLTATAVLLSEPHITIGAYNSDRALNADKTVSVVDVVIHDLRMTKNDYADYEAVAQSILDQLTEEVVLGAGSANDVTELNLPTSLVADHIGMPVDVRWAAIDTATNRTAYNVNLTTGQVTRGTSVQAFNLTATVTYNGTVASKTFTFQTKGVEPEEPVESNVALIENDDAPAKGAVSVWDGELYAYLDDTHNSIVINQGESRHFNRITLRDIDDYSRVSARHLGVFTSDDGQEWTKQTGWLMHRAGRTYTLYNLDATAKYVKVHCYHDDLDLVEGPTFYNKVADMITVSDEKYLPGATGNFKYSDTFDAVNDTGVEKKDTPVFVSLAELGAGNGQYKAGCADFRFTIDETTLAHWYNGQDGFYVRVPSIPANGSTTVTAHWGSKTAVDFSDGEATFEVTYGNVSLINISRETHKASGGNAAESLLSHGRPFTFPNGEVIVVGRTMQSASNVAVFRSTDGGHTFAYDNLAFSDSEYVGAVAYSTSTAGATYGRSSGFGGYLWDGERDENPNDDYKGRLYLLTYNGKGNNTSDYRLVLTYSDDYGRTWSPAEFLSLPGSDDVYKAGTNPKQSAVKELKNTDVRMTGTEVAKRAIVYCDGLTVKVPSGDGETFVNRYVVIHNDTVYEAATPTEVLEGNMKEKQLRNVTTAIYSDDGGETWYCSDTLISIPDLGLSRNNEDGTTEAGFAQLDDGRLRLVIRAQQEGNYYLYEGISEDYGTTWKSKYSDVISSNTAPMLVEYGADRLQMWSACNGLGQTSYRRTPLHLGLSINEYATFDKIIDLTFATAFDSVKATEGRKTQTGIAIDPDSNTAFVSYYDQNWHENKGAWTTDTGKFKEKGGTMGLVLEDFNEMVYGTKGAWDDFEVSSLKYQGWLVDADGAIELSREQAVSGRYSMKVMDKTGGSPAHALRQIPSIKSGTVGAKLMVPSTNEAPFVMELKSAYNYEHMKFTVAAIFITPSGTVGYVDADGTRHDLTTVEADTWHDYTVTIDVETNEGALYIDGTRVGAFTLPSATKDVDLAGNEKNYAAVHGVTVVQFNQVSGTQAYGDCLYVDDFFVSETAGITRAREESASAQTTIGRFITIVKKIIEVDGEQVELVEWGWVPGL